MLERGWASSGWRASDLDPTPAAAWWAGLGTGPAAPAGPTAPAPPTAAAAAVGWATVAAGLTTAVRLAWATEAVVGRATRLGVGWARPVVAVVVLAIAGERRCTSILRSSCALAAALGCPMVGVAREEPEARPVLGRRPVVVGAGRSSPAWAQLARRRLTERRMPAAASIRTTSTATSPALPLLSAGS